MLIVHRARRADLLIDPLLQVLSAAPDDPLAAEVIAVPSPGVERWVSQQVALTLGAAGADDGVAANIDYPRPTRLVGDVLARAADLTIDEDPWVGPRLVWNVLEVIDAGIAEPWTAVLAHHLGLDGAMSQHRAGRRYATAALLAQLYTSYGDNRPAMLIDWAGEHDTDGAGERLTPDLGWQPALWRRLRAHLGVPSPAERLSQACTRLRDEPELADLPGRLSLFGPTRLSRTQLDVLDALAAGRELHLWLTHPSPTMWDLLAQGSLPTRRAADTSALQLSNPLLANLSRDIRELQQRLPPEFVDRHHLADTDSPDTVLARIQLDIAQNRAPGDSPRRAADRSVQIHACHGPIRQVEVLREELLHMLADDDTLQPRDIIVLCPDVETFAPLITAAFAAPDADHPGHQLRVRMADRGLTQLNPLLDTIATLLALADGRVTASEIADLIATDPIARRFAFSDADQDVLRQWIVDGGARWGLWQRERRQVGLGYITQNTFAAALDRLLLGIAADGSELDWLGDALPLAGVDSADVALAGRFAEFLERLDAALSALAGPHSPQRWQHVLHDALDTLTACADTHVWQRTQAARRITEALTGAGERDIALTELRDVLAAVVAPRPSRASFRTGDLTVATLVPMRFVPHRIVAVIGLDDGHFPRVTHINGDDILGTNPCVGERDPRSEDRQLLLDALMSASDRLLICFSGADPVTGVRLPPVAPLADIIDTVTATVEEGVTVVDRQPLQPHDPSNFVAPQPFSYDRHNFTAALEMTHALRSRPPFLPGPLPAPPTSEVSLEDLIAFVVHPAKAFLRQRLDISVWQADKDLHDALPLALNDLEKWKIGDRLLGWTLTHPDGQAATRFSAAEQLRGTLAPGPLGAAAMADIDAGAAVVAHSAAGIIGAEAPQTQRISLDIGSVRITGTISAVYGPRLVSLSYSRLKVEHRLTAWVRLLALAAVGYPVHEAVTLGRIGGNDPAVRCSVLTTPEHPDALLTQLLELRAAGLRYPLPMATESSFVYAERRLRTPPDDGYPTAANTWCVPGGSYNNTDENTDPALVCIYGPNAPFTAVWDQPGPPGHNWYDDEPTWFAQLALRVWEPLLAQESVTRLR